MRCPIASDLQRKEGKVSLIHRRRDVTGKHIPEITVVCLLDGLPALDFEGGELGLCGQQQRLYEGSRSHVRLVLLLTMLSNEGIWDCRRLLLAMVAVIVKLRNMH